MNTAKGILICVLICSLIATAVSVQCYSCFYDAEHTSISDKLWNKECISEDFDGTKAEIKEGQDRCYKALVSMDGHIMAAHRGPGVAVLENFIAAVSRNAEDFEVHYCNTDLCNGASSVVTSLALLSTVFVILRSVFN